MKQAMPFDEPWNHSRCSAYSTYSTAVRSEEIPALTST
jgi:hypothetical protein